MFKVLKSALWLVGGLLGGKVIIIDIPNAETFNTLNQFGAAFASLLGIAVVIGLVFDIGNWVA
ncbi:hypothetical protein H2202_011316, partial [Exophiala xenobiotica]